MRSELIDDRHLARRAVIYIRQSTPHQVLTNQESLRLQYDLRRRALDLGWREEDVEVIDIDLGLSGAAATHREGFKDLIARVTLGQVGIVLSSEVTRLSRNCTDWYPLLDLCGYRQCLIGDRAAAPGLEGHDLRDGAAYYPYPLDCRPAEQGRARRARARVAGRPGPRRGRHRGQGPRSRGAIPPRADLCDLPAGPL